MFQVDADLRAAYAGQRRSAGGAHEGAFVVVTEIWLSTDSDFLGKVRFLDERSTRLAAVVLAGVAAAPTLGTQACGHRKTAAVGTHKSIFGVVIRLCL